MEAQTQEKPTEQAQEEVNEVVDPEEDETKTKAHVRILLASWALANQKEEAVEEAHIKESEESEDESEKDQPVVTSGEKTNKQMATDERELSQQLGMEE